MARLSPYTFPQELDNNANPLSGGLIYTYSAGTTTPKATYTSADGLTANPNPVVLDSSGRADIWLGEGAYKLILKTSTGTTIDTIDNVTGEAPSVFGADVVSLATNTNITSSYRNNCIECTASLILTLDSAASLGEGFYFSVRASSGTVTIDPYSSETVNGSTTFSLTQGQSALIISNGTNWLAIFDGVPADGSITSAKLNTSGVVLPSGSSATTLAAETVGTGVATGQYAVNAAIGYALGFPNKIRNGSFSVAQRGTSGTVSSGSSSYSLDGWVLNPTGATISWSQTSAGYAGVDNSTASYNALTLTGASSMTGLSLYQRIEGLLSASLAGRVCVFQITVQNNTGASITPTITVKTPTVQNVFSTTTTDVSAVSLQTVTSGSTAVLSYAFTANSSAYLGMQVQIDFGASLNSGSKNVVLYNADVRLAPNYTVGLVSSAPIPSFLNRVDEVLLNCRYFERSLLDGSLETSWGSGNTAYGEGRFTYKTRKISTPTITYGYTSIGAGDANWNEVGSGSATVTSSLLTSNLDYFMLSCGTTSRNPMEVSTKWQATSEL